MSIATDTCEQETKPDRTFLHLKGCGRCRNHWPMIASVLDTLDDRAVRTVTMEQIIERGML